MFDDLGDRMKLYEGVEAQRRFDTSKPVVARLDGRSFSKFTKDLTRPFDWDFTHCMVATTKFLVESTGACIGYSQSDEISLVWYSENAISQIYFDGRVAKMTSQLVAQATLFFYREVVKNLPSKFADRFPTFDARVWNVPDKTEAANAFLWREWDAVKNSISMAAHHHFGHSKTLNKNSAEKIEMLESIGVKWEEYPSFFRNGTFIQRRKVLRKFTFDEISNLPEKHAARTNPDLEVSRTVVDEICMPSFKTVKNREDVIFYGATPEV